MSKQGKRKITVELPKSKDLTSRPSVFERLGTKKTSSKKTPEHCRQWAQHGSCAYGKTCKFASSHTLISPSKQRAANKDSEQKSLAKDDGKNRLHSTVVVRSGRSPDAEIDNWDQNDLEYADTDVLEKRRQQLRRELELQMKMDSGKDNRKEKKKVVSSSSSSRSSSSSSASSSSSEGSSSSSSTDRDTRRKQKKNLKKRNSSSSSDGETPVKKKYAKSNTSRRDKSVSKKPNLKKDDKTKKPDGDKKKIINKVALAKKSLSPGKKSGGTPPITTKSNVKAYSASKHAKSPPRKEVKKSVSPPPKDRDKDRGRTKERDKDKEKEKERDKDRDRKVRSRSPRKARSRSPRRNSSHPKDPRRKDNSETSRPISPKKLTHGSSDRHRKGSASRDRDRRDHKDRSLERRKDSKHDDKDRHDRKDRLDRGRDRTKDTKRDDKRSRGGRDRGLGRGGADKGLEKPNKPMERLLPRPEERLAALAAISNRALEADKSSTTSKDRQDTHSDRGGRKSERTDRNIKRSDRLDSIDREPGDYEMGIERSYERAHSMERYERVDDRYDDVQREDDRSPGYLQSRDRHYDTGFEISGPPRGYPDDDDRMYDDRIGEHRGADLGYNDRRPHRDRSWEGRSASIDRERNYAHPHKEWDNEDYRNNAEWGGRERHWSMHESQMADWGDKEANIDNWHRGPPGPHRPRHEEYGRGVRMDVRQDGNKRRPQREPETSIVKEGPSTASSTAAQRTDVELDDKPIPDDLSEISDDPDDILDREDMLEQTLDEDSQVPTQEGNTIKQEDLENQSTQDTSGIEEKESQDTKDDEDITNLGFEEISDGELEEERTRGLGDALGVDWASLVADVRRREQPTSTGGARDRWRPERLLARIGISLQMAGRETVQKILDLNHKNKSATTETNSGEETVQNGAETSEIEGDLPSNVDLLHPVASIQVAINKRRRERAALFGTGCKVTRAMSARRDLALRRHLCQLPPIERSGQAQITPQPSLFHDARALLLQTSATG